MEPACGARNIRKRITINAIEVFCRSTMFKISSLWVKPTSHRINDAYFSSVDKWCDQGWRRRGFEFEELNIIGKKKTPRTLLENRGEEGIGASGETLIFRENKVFDVGKLLFKLLHPTIFASIVKQGQRNVGSYFQTRMQSSLCKFGMIITENPNAIVVGAQNHWGTLIVFGACHRVA